MWLTGLGNFHKNFLANLATELLTHYVHNKASVVGACWLTVDEDLLPGDVAPVPGEGERELLDGREVPRLEQRRHYHLVKLVLAALPGAAEYRYLMEEEGEKRMSANSPSKRLRQQAAASRNLGQALLRNYVYRVSGASRVRL